MKKYILGTLAAAIASVLLMTTIHAQLIQQGISSEVLRFHVLANSDSSADQALKLQVRNAVGTYMSGQLESADSLAESRRIVEENLSAIEEIASAAVQNAGYDYAVSASLETSVFPEKTYGIFTFPSGAYEALRVVIGEGAGHNWWCVLYPNLCFAGSMYEVVDGSEEKLQAVLTTEEYAAILNSGDCKVEFKILEFLNDML